MQRREFLASSALTVAGTASLLGADAPGKAVASERIRVGCVGAGGRALSLVNSFSRNKNCEVVALADLDPGKFGPAVAAVEKNQGTTPQTVADFRKLIDDKSLDTREGPMHLLPGMTVTAEIKVGTRTIISYFLYPLLRGLDDSIREP